MTRVVYEPELPAIEFDGHAGAGLRGRDPVCAALSILLFTLVEGVEGAQIRAGDAYCRVKGGDKARAVERHAARAGGAGTGRLEPGGAGGGAQTDGGLSRTPGSQV